MNDIFPFPLKVWTVVFHRISCTAVCRSVVLITSLLGNTDALLAILWWEMYILLAKLTGDGVEVGHLVSVSC